MATPITKTVKEAAGDYSTLAAAEAGEEKDLVSADEQLTFEISEAWVNAEPGSILIGNVDRSDAWVTDATRYLRIYCKDDGAKHKGKWTTNAYRIEGVGTSGLLQHYINYIHIEGLQCGVTNGVGYSTGISDRGIVGDRPNANEIIIEDCILREISNSGISATYGIWTNGNGNYKIRNTLIYDFYRSGIISYSQTRILDISNCTVYGIIGDGRAIFLNDSSTVSSLIRNCVIFNNDDDVFNDGYSTFSYCASDDVIAGTGNFQITQSADDYTEFVVDAANDDYRTASVNSELYSAGIDLSGDFTDDIDGKTRSNWDIGCSEYQATVLTKTIATSGGDYTSVAAFAAGEAVDLVHTGQQITAEISGIGVTDTGVDVKASQGWHTGIGNYIKVITLDNGARHNGVYSTNAYRAESNPSALYDIDVQHIWLDGLQIYQTSAVASRGGIRTTGAIDIRSISVSNCIVRGTTSANNDKYGIKLALKTSIKSELKVWNNVVYDWTSSGANNYGISLVGFSTNHDIFAYNNTTVGVTVGMLCGGANPNNVFKNNIVQDATTNYSGTFDGASTNNLDDDGTAPGSNPQNNKTLTFANKGANNYALAVGDAASETGADLSGDADLPITKDIKGTLRSVPLDIGAFCCAEAGEGDDASTALVSAVMRKNDRRRLLYADD